MRSRRRAKNLDETMAKCHRPTLIVRRDRPSPARPELDVAHRMESAVVLKDVARLELMRLNLRHLGLPFHPARRQVPYVIQDRVLPARSRVLDTIVRKYRSVKRLEPTLRS